MRKANLQAVDQLRKTAEKARVAMEKAQSTSPVDEGGKGDRQTKTSDSGSHVGGHSGNGH
ncbi:hypothetical protein D3C85_1789110 [compost metagenome]